MSDILLEAGSNEVEVLELILGQQHFGVNVLKIRQILQFDPQAITPIPGMYHSVLGNFLFHGQSIPLIDLKRHINIEEAHNDNMPLITLVCDFNHILTGFLISGIDRIHRISWQDIQSPSSLVLATDTKIVGSTVIDHREILLLDFEAIIQDITGPTNFQELERPTTEKEVRKQRQREDIKLLIVDDSPIIRHGIEQRLVQAKYNDVISFNNGEAVFHKIMELKKKAEVESKSITDYLIIVISDIEMPGMDGLTLCKKLKEEVPEVYVIIMSSLINEQIALKCEQVFADAYLSKSDKNQLIDLIDQFCL